jgi:N-acyl-D-aspartate/D-glutamate deacylase
MSEFDLVVRSGLLVDGTGAPARTADVAVRDGVVAEVGKVGRRGAREIDADGALVTPGFVDIHTHFDGQATWDSALAPSSWHGVTTVVMGNCGVGFAPVRPVDHDRLIELMEGVEDIPGIALHEGLTWEWETFAEFLDVLDSHPHDIDFATQVPHGALRLHVMGDRGASRDPATPKDIEEMGLIAQAAVEAGALGFTTSRTLNHRTSRGEPTPTLTAAADELVGIANAMGRSGKGVLQVVSDFIDAESEFGVFRRMVEESGRPLSFSLVQSRAGDQQYRWLLERLDEANRDGLPMTAQVAARGIGLLLGLQCTLNPFMANPVWREISSFTAKEQSRAMAEPAFRERLLAEGVAPERGKLGGLIVTMFDRMYELGDPPAYEPDSSQSLAARAERQGCRPEELAYDLLAADEGRTFLYLPFLDYLDGNLDAVGEMLRHPHTVPGLGDGGAHVGTISDGSFPTTLLAYWGRDRPKERLEVPFIVQRQCHATARAVGLTDRGVLVPGYKADLNVIDFDQLDNRRPEMRYDLPAGGKRLLQRAAGYVHTFVNGTETYSNGEATGALPGRLVRSSVARPAANRL